MSFNRLNYDTCQYRQTIYESVGPGDYMLTTPSNGCDYCYPWPPTVRLQQAGNSIDRSKTLVDTHSNLLNIEQPASKCPKNKWISQNVNSPLYKFNPQSQTVVKNKYPVHESFTNPPLGENRCHSKDQKLTHWKDCFSHSIESRYSHPASTLRGTGFDRWEYLCFNPQEKATIPFDCYIPNRILVKDNHRPCIPQPLDYRPSLPPNNGPLSCEKTTPVCAAPTRPPSIQCDAHQQYQYSS